MSWRLVIAVRKVHSCARLYEMCRDIAYASALLDALEVVKTTHPHIREWLRFGPPHRQKCIWELPDSDDHVSPSDLRVLALNKDADIIRSMRTRS